VVAQLLYDYQTLVAGTLAVAAAIVGALALRNQTNSQRKIAEAAAHRHTKAAIAALVAEVHAMKQHLLRTKNAAIAHAQAGWEHNPEYIRIFYNDIPDIFKYYYRDAVVIPVRIATKISDVVKQLTAINALVGTSALVTDATQRQHYQDIGDQLDKLYDRVMAVLDDLGQELEHEF
jgi:hypothetical protein